jgi:hypothetical protein
MLDLVSSSHSDKRAYLGPGGIADDSGVDVSARTTLGLFITECVSIEEATSKTQGQREENSYTGPACASRAAKRRLRAELNSILQRIM